MRIEILYVPGCPNYQPAVERLQEVSASQSVQGEIHSVPVNRKHRPRRRCSPVLRPFVSAARMSNQAGRRLPA